LDYIVRKSQEYLRKKRARRKINMVKKNQKGANFRPPLYVGFAILELIKNEAHYLLIF